MVSCKYGFIDTDLSVFQKNLTLTFLIHCFACYRLLQNRFTICPIHAVCSMPETEHIISYIIMNFILQRIVLKKIFSKYRFVVRLHL